MHVTDYAGTTSHEDIYSISLHWSVRSHSVSAEGARNDTGEHVQTLEFILYKEDSAVPGLGSQTMDVSDALVVSLHIKHPSVDNSNIRLMCRCILAITACMPFFHITGVAAQLAECTATHIHIREVTPMAWLIFPGLSSSL